MGLRLLRDRLRVRARLRVSSEGHWSDLARAMTTLTMLLKDGKNVAVKRGTRLLGLRGARQTNHDDECQTVG